MVLYATCAENPRQEAGLSIMACPIRNAAGFIALATGHANSQDDFANFNLRTGFL